MRKTLLTLCIAMASLSAFAVPAKKGTTLIRLADGTELKAELQGDEFMHYYLGEDGKCYTQGEGGIYVPFNRDEARQAAMKLRGVVNENITTKRRLMRKAAGEKKGYFGSKKGLILLVQFPDRQFQDAHDKAFYEKFANGVDYKEGSFRGSVRDYYRDQSNGQFDLSFDIMGPLTAPQSYKYYGQNKSNGSDAHVGTLLTWALDQVKDQLNFKDYDWDGDGYADQVFLLYAGQGENFTGAPAENIWPHMFYLSSSDYGRVYDTGQGVYMNTYACSCELNAYSQCDGIGTVCHEFSHCLGFMDLYDTDYSGGYGMGDWDLLHSGNYNGNGFCPAGFTGYEKWVAGWTEPVELKKDIIVSNLKPLSENGETYIMYNENNANEYYFIDNRQQTGWDSSLPGQGLLVTHVDYNERIWASNSVNDDPAHQRMSPFHADNMPTYRNASGDPYPYVESGVVKNDSLSDLSKPAATLFNTNIDGTKYMGKALLDITQNSDRTVSFRFRGMKGMNTDFNVGDVLFNETFDTNEGKGGNDGVWAVSTSTALSTDVAGWGYNKGYAAFKCARFGSKAVPGEAYTPTFNIPCKVRLTFKAAPYNGDDNTIDVYFGNRMLDRFFMEDGKWNEFSVDFTGTGYDRIYFNGGQRFFLDDVKVTVIDDNESAINDAVVEKTMNDGRIYTIDGRYVGTNLNALGRGIYIMGGKKVVR